MGLDLDLLRDSSLFTLHLCHAAGTVPHAIDCPTNGGCGAGGRTAVHAATIRSPNYHGYHAANHASVLSRAGVASNSVAAAATSFIAGAGGRTSGAGR